ncbi:MAG TPA: hypothetical protein VIL20_01015, partial [Sandaracinaceae bacterium]
MAHAAVLSERVGRPLRADDARAGVHPGNGARLDDHFVPQAVREMRTAREEVRDGREVRVRARRDVDALARREHGRP